MSKTLETFRKQMVDSGWWKKLFKSQTPGARIGPAKNRPSEYRLDSGEVHDGKKKVNLQVNSEAKSDAAVNYRKKNGTHANLATGFIDINTPEDKQKEVFEAFWGDVAEQAKDRLS